LAIYGLISDRSAGRRKKLAVISASITGTGSITTGLNSVDFAIAGSVEATALNSADVTSVSGGTVNVRVILHGATDATETVARTVVVHAVGD